MSDCRCASGMHTCGKPNPENELIVALARVEELFADAEVRKNEIWRVKYEPRFAYRDQTGLPHSGHIVYERILVADTGERYDVDDGYSLHPNHGRICVSEDGRLFRLHTETVDYSGGTHIKQEDKPESQEGYWQTPPWLPTGYVYEDGSAPVGYLTLDDEELRKREERADNRRQAEALRREADRLERAR